LYGPSKLADVDNLKSCLEKGILHVKCWLYEGFLHSALLHYIAYNMENLLEHASEEDIILFPIKDFYSLLESEDLKINSEDTLMNFLQKYVKYHAEDNLADILKAIRINRVSTENLMDALKNPVLKENSNFITRVCTELNFRSIFWCFDKRNRKILVTYE